MVQHRRATHHQIGDQDGEQDDQQQAHHAADGPDLAGVAPGRGWAALRGADEDEAVDTLVELVESGFEEEE